MHAIHSLAQLGSPYLLRSLLDDNAVKITGALLTTTQTMYGSMFSIFPIQINIDTKITPFKVLLAE